MADYKGMYLELVDKTSKAIGLLQEGLLTAEEIYVSQEEETVIELVQREDTDDPNQ